MPEVKEIHFFDRDFHRGLEQYEKFFEGADAFKAVGEATPDYIYLPDVAPRIREVLPECRFILSLRNPIDRVYSRYWNSKRRFQENENLSFEDKLAQKPLFLEEGFYYDHLIRFYDLFGRDRFLILLFEEIQTAPGVVLRRMFEFLGVDPSFEPTKVESRINSASSAPGLGRSKLLHSFHLAASKLGMERLAQQIYRANAVELPPMNPNTRKWLKDEVYGDKNRKLSDLTGLDLSGWT